MKGYFPDYKNSILNLMGSIARGFNAKTGYSSLSILNPEEIKKAKNVVLIVLDGLGYEYLMKYGQKSELAKHLRGKITSIFPATTGTCIPAFMTGVSSQEHGMSGWYIYLKEIGMVMTSLPFITRFGEFNLGESVDINKLFKLNPITNKLKAKSYVLQPEEIIDTDFTLACSGKAKISGYETLSEMFKKIEELIKGKTKERKYIYCYNPNPDRFLHEFGNEGKKVLSVFNKIDKEFTKFLKRIKGTSSIIIVTADHGLMTVPKNKKIDTKKYPELNEFLRIPLCGEGRLGYTYVKAGKEKAFEKYVKNKLGFCIELVKSKDALKKGWFGRGKIHPEFKNRIGDYILLMKENYGIKDFLIDSENAQHLGRHGGTSKQEMFVPLIVVNNKN